VTVPKAALDWKHAALIGFCAAVPLLVTFEQYAVGAVCFAAAAFATWRTHDAIFQSRFFVLLLCVALLALAPISTNTATVPALTLGAFLVAVVVLPYWLLAKPNAAKTTDGVHERVVSYQWWPKRFSKLEAFYVLLSIPLAWGGLRLYFTLSPEVPFNWTLPPTPTDEPLLRLFFGINAVGIWDELFFINTVFAVLRSLYPFWIANFAQTVLYVAVLNDMAFTGWGPLFVAVLALTQGIMFERSRTLVYVVLVHLIVDYFLFQEIVSAHYPGFKTWWHP
jgi:membrane protease YdiL (CAAX protease family)